MNTINKRKTRKGQSPKIYAPAAVRALIGEALSEKAVTSEELVAKGWKYKRCNEWKNTWEAKGSSGFHEVGPPLMIDAQAEVTHI